MDKRLLSTSEVNALDYEEFIDRFGNVIENCPVFAAAIWVQRPFHNLNYMHSWFCKLIDELPELAREGILRCHPDLAGRMALQGLLTSESTKEQKAAGLDGLTDEERHLLAELNESLMKLTVKYLARYKRKFGFPFVICARENKKEAILHGIRVRVENDAKTELNTGIEEVKKIAKYRLMDIMK